VHFLLHGGENTLSGDIAAAQSILVQGSDAGGHAKLTAAASFTNAGTITLESINQGWASDLAVTSGTLTNTGTFIVNPGSGGPRRITGDFLNQGSFVLDGISLSLAGAYTQTVAGVLSETGLRPGAGALLQVSGTATLDGTLSIALAGGYVPNVGDPLSVLTFGSRSGDFAATSGFDLGGGLFLSPQYDDSSLTLLVSSM
jgi:hypothetical protein